MILRLLLTLILVYNIFFKKLIINFIPSPPQSLFLVFIFTFLFRMANLSHLHYPVSNQKLKL